MGMILFAVGLVLVGIALLYLVVKVAWYAVRVVGLTGFTLANLGYHLAVIKPRLERNGFLGRKQAEAEERRASAEAKARAIADQRAAKLAQSVDTQRRRVEAAYPLADAQLVDAYVDAFLNRTMAEADEAEAQLAQQQRLRAHPLFDVKTLAGAQPVAKRLLDGLTVTVLQDTSGGAAVQAEGASSRTGCPVSVVVPVKDPAAAHLALNDLAAASKDGLTEDKVVAVAGAADAHLASMRRARTGR